MPQTANMIFDICYERSIHIFSPTPFLNAMLISEETQADHAVSNDATKKALALAGAWSDLDFDEMLDALDHIRHDSKPTPPIELDL